MRLRLTDIAVRKLALPSSGQQTYWDATTPGFGVRCSTRSKSYVVMYGPKRRLKTLGRHPELGLADARKRAKLQLVQHQSRSDDIGNFDYQMVLSEYLVDCEQRLRPSTIDGYTLYLSAIHFSGPVDQVTRQDIMRKIREYTKSPSSQNYAFTTLKVFFNWLVRYQYLQTNPLDGLNRPHAPTSRDRVLSRDETSQLLQYTLGNRDRFNDIVSLLLMTGQRRGEIAGLQWSEIDQGQLSFDAQRTKNKHRHDVPIPALAVDLLESIEGGSTYVFGTPEADTPFNGWARAQRRLLHETGLSPFTLHDLRRTFATLHADIGTPIHVTERLLNHRSGTISGVAAIYNRHSYLGEMKEATQLYGELLAKLHAAR
ncbi:tyrosine-type recombinase/integrase [Rhodophyticola sp.]|uniref:tyrosine-type recombinase/integrase n=1 Tax=Rhodophyticola sp. TaxID=2680032 RepID=UPI003D27AEB2